MARKKLHDMPFDSKDIGTKFVTLVVIMMTALATITLGGALIVGGMRANWVDAVKGHITIEIPAADAQGTMRSHDALAQTAKTLEAALPKIGGVVTVQKLSDKDVEALVKPWLGAGAGTDDLPLPVLMGVTMSDPDDKAALKAIAAAVQKADPAATAETHQTWISDLRRFSLVLLLAACAMAAATIACCIVTVAGAVQARLSEHQADIDLLHVMGATDEYIGSQFVNLIVRSVGGAAAIGMGIGIVLLKVGGFIAGEMQSAALTGISRGFTDYLWFAALPALVTGLCFVAARVTVLRSLRVMP